MGLHLDKEVDVAFECLLASGERTEKANRRCPVLSGTGYNGVPVGVEQKAFHCADCRWGVFRARCLPVSV